MVAPAIPGPAAPCVRPDAVANTRRVTPERYVRRVKGGRWQARPYVAEEQRRYDLGLFGTVGEALRAVAEFWWGKRAEVPRYTRRLTTRGGGSAYAALVPFAGRLVVVGLFADRAAAGAAASHYCRLVYGEREAAAMLAGRK